MESLSRKESRPKERDISLQGREYWKGLEGGVVEEVVEGLLRSWWRTDQ